MARSRALFCCMLVRKASQIVANEGARIFAHKKTSLLEYNKHTVLILRDLRFGLNPRYKTNPSVNSFQYRVQGINICTR